MSKNFDWHTEEEAGWEPEPPAARGKTPPRRLAVWLWLPALLLAGFGGLFLFRGVDEQVTAVDTAVRADVLAAHGLIQHANVLRDVELIRANLSARDDAWTGYQKQLVAEGRLWDLSAIGLRLDLAAPVAAPDVTLSPNLRAAEVSFEAAYQSDTGVVRLRQTAVYRRGENGRWLYAPPLSAYWGEQVTQVQDGLRVVGPARDAEFAALLAVELAETRQTVCKTLADLNCAPGAPLTVVLSQDVASLDALADPAVLLTGDPVMLPAPSLLGRPQDLAGQRALLRGYAVQLATAVIAQQTGYRCCENGPFFRALADAQLAELGLQPWPLSAADYEALLLEDVRLSRASALWLGETMTLDGGEWRWAHALVAHLLQAPGAASAATMLRQLGDTFPSWLSAASRDVYAIEAAWPRFVFDRSRSGQRASPPVALPADRLEAVCRGTSDTAQGLYRYDFAAGRWIVSQSAQGSDASYLSIIPLPRPDAYLVQNSTLGQRRTQLQLWQAGEQFVIFESSDNGSRTVAYPVGSDPARRYTVVGFWSSQRGLSTFRLLDLDSCSAGRCDLVDLPGWPAWSPGGASTLLQVPEGEEKLPVIYRGNARGGELIAVGMAQAAYWLDDDTILLAQVGQSGEMELARVEPGEHAAQPWLDSADFRAALAGSAGDEQTRLQLFYAAAASPTQLFVLLRALGPQARETQYVLLVTHEAGVVSSMVPVFEAAILEDLRPAPDGRWTAVRGRLAAAEESESQTVTQLMNLQTGAAATLPGGQRYFWRSAWTSDSSWYGAVFSNYILLVAPDAGYHYLVPFDVAGCDQIFWSVGS